MTKVCNLYANLGVYFEFPFTMTDVGNLYTNLGIILNYLAYWQRWVIDAKLGGCFIFFHSGRSG